MRGCSRKKLDSRRVAHKSTGGMLYAIPEPVDPVGNAPPTQLGNAPSTQLLIRAHGDAKGSTDGSLTTRTSR